MLSKELERRMAEAAENAKESTHEFITLEHLLLALTRAPVVVEILEACNANVQRLKQSLRVELDRQAKLNEDQLLAMGGEKGHWSPEFTIACHRVLQRAALQVQSAGKKEINEANVLIAIFHEQDSPAAYLLKKEGISQFDIIQMVSHGPSVTPPEPDLTKAPKEARSLLVECCANLNELVIKGKSDPLIGRQDVLDRVILVLSRRNKNNPLLIGEPGVGKTAIAEGLAQLIVGKKVPENLHDATIFSLDLASLMAGTKFRGDFEAKLKNVIKELRSVAHPILFIDEIHTIVGAGATNGGSMDVANLIKPLLSDGSLSVMGSTTFGEYRKHFEKDRALNRRFQRIDVNEPSQAECVEILRGIQSKYQEFHKVIYSDSALKAAVDLSAKYLHQRQLPDKAIDLIDEAGASLVLHPDWVGSDRVIDEKVIERVLSNMTQIPLGSITISDTQMLRDLDKKLKAQVFGQDSAVEQLVTALKLARSGLRPESKPMGSFLFAGPTGVGKTEVAKQLALIMGLPLVRFDMSEYMEKHTVARLVGAPPGYVGYEEGGLLTEAVFKSPYCVLLMDEIEKAHPDLMGILLQVMDAGRLTDSNGRVSDMRNVILIMTSNAGSQEVAKGQMGIGPMDRRNISIDVIKRSFSPEFLNRLDSIVQFNDLDEKILLMVVDKLLFELSTQLLQKKIAINVSDDARHWLVKKGYEPAYGARPMARAIDQNIKKHLVDAVLFGSLSQNGGEVFVDLDLITQALKVSYGEEKNPDKNSDKNSTSGHELAKPEGVAGN